MKKALFVFFEGLAENVIDSQVLIHCRLMKNIGIEFEIWSFACNERLYQYSTSRLNEAKKRSNCEVKVFKGLRPAYPFSEKINALILTYQLRKHQPVFKFVHARTDYSTDVVCRAITNRPVVYDCRGDSIAEFCYKYRDKSFNLFKSYRLYKLKKNVKYAKQKSNRAIFVSNFLKEKIGYDKTSTVIGCVADSNLFYYSQTLRKKIRENLSLSNDKKVLIYSGGMNKYQCFGQCVIYFKKLLEQDKKWHFLVLTIDLDKAQEKIVDTKNIILKKVPFEAVNQYLNAADVGIILREDNDLNRAASPTKFAEYALSGLSIVYSKSIGNLEQYANDIGGYYVIDTQTNLSDFGDISDMNQRSNRADTARQILSKDQVIKQYRKIYA